MKFKKITAVILSIIMLLGCFSMIGFAADGDAKPKLKFNDNGKFKILNYSDLQKCETLDKYDKLYIEQTMTKEKPDLVVLTGDNIGGGCKDKDGVKTAIAEFMDIFEKFGVPVAICFGNHDAENPATKEEQMKMYQEYKCNLSIDQDPLWLVDLSGCGTYNVPIYSSNGMKIAFNIWMMDSGMYDGNGNYDRVHEDQLQWYKTKSTALKLLNGGKPVPSICFQHIIVPEIWDALKEVKKGTHGCQAANGKYYVLPEGASGSLEEYPCPGVINDGQFETMKEQGDVLAIVNGHDHINQFDINYEGIRLINTPRAGEIKKDMATRGVRVIEIDESNPTAFTTKFLDGIADMEDTQLYIFYYIRYIFHSLAHTVKMLFKFK